MSSIQNDATARQGNCQLSAIYTLAINDCASTLQTESHSGVLCMCVLYWRNDCTKSRAWFISSSWVVVRPQATRSQSLPCCNCIHHAKLVLHSSKKTSLLILDSTYYHITSAPPC